MISLHFKSQEEKETIYKMLQDVMYIEGVPFEIIERDNRLDIKPPLDLVPLITASYKTIINHLRGT